MRWMKEKKATFKRCSSPHTNKFIFSLNFRLKTQFVSTRSSSRHCLYINIYSWPKAHFQQWFLGPKKGQKGRKARLRRCLSWIHFAKIQIRNIQFLSHFDKNLLFTSVKGLTQRRVTSWRVDWNAKPNDFGPGTRSPPLASTDTHPPLCFLL